MGDVQTEKVHGKVGKNMDIKRARCREAMMRNNKYLLVTEFEVRTVSYGPSFFPLIYGPSAKRAGHKSTGKNEDP